MDPNKKIGLTKLQFKPGIVTDVTGYTNAGGWRDCNMFRFRFGLPQTIGGWSKLSVRTYLGTCRTMNCWTTLSNKTLLSIGTHIKYYIEEGGYFYDITPIRETQALNNPFNATNGSSIITVADVGHGASPNCYVTFSGASGLGPNVTASKLNKNHRILTVPNNDSYTIDVGVTAGASDTGLGGSVTAKYEINPGLDTEIGGYGWGSSTWGRGTWGSASDSATTGQLRIWHQDNFGEDLIMNVFNGGIYYWQASLGLSTNAVELASLSDDATCPTVAKQVIVSDRDRHVIVFGCDSGDGTMDPLLIRFSNQEDPFTWRTLATNTAGDLRLGSGSEILRAVETKREILVFTDASLHSMQWIGPPYTFGITQISGVVSLMAPLAAASVDDAVYWMGKNGFFVYAGSVNEIPCPVRDYVFNDINLGQSNKISCSHNDLYKEVWWYYPSASSSKCDRYVVFNYSENCWYYGEMSRSCFYHSPVQDFPVGCDESTSDTADNYLYQHETGTDADGVAINAYIESSPIELGDGDSFMFISRMIHDVSFTGSVITNPVAKLTVKTSAYPGADFNYTVESNTTRTAIVPIQQFTPYADIRLRGRQVAFRLEKDISGVALAMGTPRLELRADGRR